MKLKEYFTNKRKECIALATEYDRKYRIGRGSEQHFNEELHKMYESIRHLLEIPQGKDSVPEAILDGSIWFDRKTNELKGFNKSNNTWIPIFKEKHQIVDQITNQLPPANPVLGQLWLYNDVLMYYTGSDWKPVKALEQDGSQFNLSVFENFLLISPLWKIGNTIVKDEAIKQYEVELKKYLQGKIDSLNNAAILGDGSKFVIDQGGWDKDLEGNIIFTTPSYNLPEEEREKLYRGWIKDFNDNLIFSRTTDVDPTSPWTKNSDGRLFYDPKWIREDSDKMPHQCGINDYQFTDFNLTGKTQLLVPNIDVDRIFIDDQLDFNYESPSKVCIEYDKKYLANKVPSLIHINPGKLTSIKKRLIKIDRDNPHIKLSGANTEFYGYRAGDIRGHFLLPTDDLSDPKDYEKMSDGIYLSETASRNYDYVLAITYEFSWFKATGTLKKIRNTDNTSNYYVQDYTGPLNIFVDGYDLEDPSYEEDNLSQTITIKENTTGHELSVIGSMQREFGFIRTVDLQNRGIIKTIHEFKNPLVFVNGEAMHPALGDIVFKDNNYIYIKNAHVDMPWCVIDLYDEENSYTMNMKADIVNDISPEGFPVIKYDPTKWEVTDVPILFIDGLLVKKEDIIRDFDNNYIYVRDSILSVGQEYILLQDRFNKLYDATKLIPAMPVGHLTESLVYWNNYLLSNNTAVITTASVEQLSSLEYFSKNVHNEIKLFVLSDLNKNIGIYRIWNETTETWDDLTVTDAGAVNSFINSYENATKSVKFNITLSDEDQVNIYAFNCANDIEHQLIIRNLPYDFYEYDEYYKKYLLALDEGDNDEIVAAKSKLDEVTAPRSSFAIKETYIPNIGSLSVWVNGIRQYDVIEWMDGTGFDLPHEVSGIITYVIENPENGATIVTEREILTHENIIPNTINVYKTTKSLYPGRVSVYINGVRQAQDAYTILDNYRLLIKDSKTQLIGAENNYPVETLTAINGDIVNITHSVSDKILVEVRQDTRIENHIYISKDKAGTINIEENDLPINILESSDEILIFVEGLFFGLSNLIGYKKDIYTGNIKILDSSVVNKICSNPLYTYLQGNPLANKEYKENTGGEYILEDTNIILEWR